MDNQIYHLVYLTRNIVNNKIYIGVHSTFNLDDGYLGSGTGIKNAIKKYGKQKFERTILYFCLYQTDAYTFEELIVDENFVKRNDTYNNITGGTIELSKKYQSENTKQKISMTRIKNGVAKGQNNPASKTNMDIGKIKNKSQKMSITRIKNGVAKGQNNPASKTNMSDQNRKEKSLKTATTRKLNGSYVVSDETKQKQSINRKGKTKPPFTEEHKYNLLLAHSKTFKLISPEGIEYIVNTGLNNFCKEHSLSPVILYKFMNQGKIDVFKNPNTNNKPKPQTTLNCNGWEITSK